MRPTRAPPSTTASWSPGGTTGSPCTTTPTAVRELRPMRRTRPRPPPTRRRSRPSSPRATDMHSSDGPSRPPRQRPPTNPARISRSVREPPPCTRYGRRSSRTGSRTCTTTPTEDPGRLRPNPTASMPRRRAVRRPSPYPRPNRRNRDSTSRDGPRTAPRPRPAISPEVRSPFHTIRPRPCTLCGRRGATRVTCTSTPTAEAEHPRP